MPACEASVASRSWLRGSKGITSRSTSSGVASRFSGIRFLLMSWMTAMTSSSAEIIGIAIIDFVR